MQHSNVKSIDTLYSQLALQLQEGLSRVPESLCLFLRQMHIGDPQDSTSTQL
uniref:Uncharacterized protein n=1 Tax=Manihot esculenta TaxID=3983 RepID=A0A2C9WC55_MANES